MLLLSLGDQTGAVPSHGHHIFAIRDLRMQVGEAGSCANACIGMAGDLGGAVKVVSIHPVRRRRKISRPLMLEGVRAGFPSPADDYMEAKIDLNEELIKNPAATFFLRVKGDSMEGAGIRDGATLVVDRSLDARDGDTVVAVVEGNLTVKRLRKTRTGCSLEAANPAYAPMKLGSDDQVWGVVTSVINQLRRNR